MNHVKVVRVFSGKWLIVKDNRAMKQKFSFLVGLLFLISSAVFPQRKGIDSLLTQLSKAGEDSNKIRLYSQLSVLYYSVNPDSFFICCHKGLDLAWKLKSRENIAKLDHKLSSMLTDTGNYALALKYAEEALSISKEIGSKKEIVNSLTNMGRVYDYQSDFVRASEYFSDAMNLAEEIGNHEQMALVGTNLGAAAFNQGDYKKAEKYALITIKEAQLANAQVHIYKGYNLLGAIKTAIGDTVHAKEYYQKAIDICVKYDFPLRAAEVMTDLARIQKDDQKTLDLLLKGRSIYDKFSPGSFGSIDNWESLAEVYISLYRAQILNSNRIEFLGKAEDYLIKMIKKCKESNNIPSLAQHTNICRRSVT
jgi:tetratricopeptide (TPR) repeat protein